MAPGFDGGLDAELTSLESTLDRATERFALALRKQLETTSGGTSRNQRFDHTTALALVRTPAFHVGQLRWKGIDVSDEFLRYAARVARGEQLTPYRGRVLARSTVEFPWSATLLGCADGLTQPTEPRTRRRKRSRALLGWTRGVGALVLCMLLVGIGAAAMAVGEPREQLDWAPRRAPVLAASQRPAPPAPAERDPAPSAAPPSDAAAIQSKPERKVVRIHKRPPATWLRAAIAAPSTQPSESARSTPRAESPASAPAPMPSEAARTPPPGELAQAADAPVMTIVGSTLLVPIEEAAPGASPLLIETPSF